MDTLAGGPSSQRPESDVGRFAREAEGQGRLPKKLRIQRRRRAVRLRHRMRVAPLDMSLVRIYIPCVSQERAEHTDHSWGFPNKFTWDFRK